MFVYDRSCQMALKISLSSLEDGLYEVYLYIEQR